MTKKSQKLSLSLSEMKDLKFYEFFHYFVLNKLKGSRLSRVNLGLLCMPHLDMEPLV